MINAITNAPEKTKDELQSDLNTAVSEQRFEDATKIMDKIKSLEGSKEASIQTKEEIKNLGAYSRDDLKNLSDEQIGKIIANDIRSKSKTFGKGGNPEDVLSMYKNLLNDSTPNAILEKQNKQLKEVVFEKSELIISPAEYIRRSRLIKMKKTIDALKRDPSYPRNAVAYFVAMTKWRKGGKMTAALHRSLINGNLKKMKIEDLKNEMKFCLEKFTSKPGETAKLRLQKNLIHDEIAKASNGFLDQIATKNRI